MSVDYGHAAIAPAIVCDATAIAHSESGSCENPRPAATVYSC